MDVGLWLLAIVCNAAPYPVINSMGEMCPWPFDPPMLWGQPLGQYHCPYCGDMQVAGMTHLNFLGELVIAVLMNTNVEAIIFAEMDEEVIVHK